MPRDIPVSNGKMLVAFDQYYQIRDLYFPRVGQEDHAGGVPCRFGVWSTLPDIPANVGERRKQRLFWSNQGWDISLGYVNDSLTTDVVMRHEQLALEMHCTDVVDFDQCVLVRRIDVHNLINEPRTANVIHHHDFHIFGTKVGDTAFFDPRLRSLVHFRGRRYLMCCFYVDGEQRIDEYATGTAGFRGAEGTWRDAEDGKLSGNTIAQGAVDSTMLATVNLPPSGRRTVYLVIGAGFAYEDLVDLQRFMHRHMPQGVIDRTNSYWRLWLAANRAQFPNSADGGPSEKISDLYKRSLLLVRSQIDDGGAIIAANDSDVMQFSRDTYSYMWPRDGALVANALDGAGFPDVSRNFYRFCEKIIVDAGFFLHKYNPDGSAASSWHPWVSLGKPQIPIQEDETALVVWALWKHFAIYRDIEFVRTMWSSLICRAGDFLVRFRDPDTHLPLPSYDLWEERWGVHAYTVATVYAGLKAAWEFAVCFGDDRRAARYGQAASQMREAFCKYMWSDKFHRFFRRIVPLDHDRTARLMDEVINGRDPLPEGQPVGGHEMAKVMGESEIGAGPSGYEPEFEYDDTLDSSLLGVSAFGLLPVHDERVRQTMDAVSDGLWVRTPVGGMARYEGDAYYRMCEDEGVPGNPWFICTLWLADYHIARAVSVADLTEALPILEWVADRALPSGVLAEQVHPHTNAPLSVSPLTWSHATVVATIQNYLRRYAEMVNCPNCGQSMVGEDVSLRSIRSTSATA